MHSRSAAHHRHREIDPRAIMERHVQDRFRCAYVIFASDNGHNLGSHALIHMMAPYEESLRVPRMPFSPLDTFRQRHVYGWPDHGRTCTYRIGVLYTGTFPPGALLPAEGLLWLTNEAPRSRPPSSW